MNRIDWSRWGVVLFRTMATIVIFFLIVILYIFTLENYFPPYPEIDTVFAKNFTWERFDQVKPGMSQDEVRQLLGEPFQGEERTNLYAPYLWEYTHDGKFCCHDFAWFYVVVEFDPDTLRVTRKSKDIHYD